MSGKFFFVYVLECADGTFYTGYTGDLEVRIARHNEGGGGRYTRARTPVKLVYSERFESRKSAMGREREIKKLSRLDKERLVGR